MKHRQSLETELKLRIPSVAALEPLLAALGFSLVQADAKEESLLWDRNDELRTQNSALRLRRYAGKATLTFKGPRVPDPQFKIRPEHETEVADAEATEALLRGLGYIPVMRMVKHRALWAREELVACLDRTPFGDYLELEGEPDAIKLALQGLCLDASRIEPRSYPALFREAGLSSVTEP
ncbi:MAG TPA: class IV adenylate cyclase [Holophagaceae bacterium]|nr:class IV adenylate cyclase [Holophagaceae bacterium]